MHMLSIQTKVEAYAYVYKILKASLKYLQKNLKIFIGTCKWAQKQHKRIFFGLYHKIMLSIRLKISH